MARARSDSFAPDGRPRDDQVPRPPSRKRAARPHGHQVVVGRPGRLLVGRQARDRLRLPELELCGGPRLRHDGQRHPGARGQVHDLAQERQRRQLARDAIGRRKRLPGGLAGRLAVVLVGGSKDGQRLPPAGLGLQVGHRALTPGRRQARPTSPGRRGRALARRALAPSPGAAPPPGGRPGWARSTERATWAVGSGRTRSREARARMMSPASPHSRPWSAAAAAASRQVEAAQATTASSSLSSARGHSRSAMVKAPSGSRAQSATLTAERRTWPVHCPGGTVSSCSRALPTSRSASSSPRDSVSSRPSTRGGHHSASSALMRHSSARRHSASASGQRPRWYRMSALLPRRKAP